MSESNGLLSNPLRQTELLFELRICNSEVSVRSGEVPHAQLRFLELNLRALEPRTGDASSLLRGELKTSPLAAGTTPSKGESALSPSARPSSEVSAGWAAFLLLPFLTFVEGLEEEVPAESSIVNMFNIIRV